MQFYTFFIQDFMKAISHDNKSFNIEEPLMAYSLKEWCVMKHIKIQKITVS